jgi:tRNA dimethylallyltransferase
MPGPHALPILAIAGPTAVGKSQLALDLCERFAAGALGARGAEIVSVDSAQIYRGMDVGTAKPDAAIRARVPHHLLDILDPAETYSAARFAAEARPLIAAIHARGRVPLLVGGTMLYFRALFEGLSELPQADPAVRAQLEAEAARAGWSALHARLARLDPPTAARLHPNDAQRIQRALEIVELTGAPASAAYALPRSPSAAQDLPGPLLRVALLAKDRSALHARIEARFLHMMEQGFADEVARLRARKDLCADLPSMRAVGYRQLWKFLDGEYDLNEAIRRGIAATRQYAKRQLTWLRGEIARQAYRPLHSVELNAADEVLSWAKESLL